jgi:hypothetical protein
VPRAKSADEHGGSVQPGACRPAMQEKLMSCSVRHKFLGQHFVRSEKAIAGEMKSN